MRQDNPIKYLKGSGRQAKAQYQLGNISVPSSAFARIEKEAEGKPEAAASRIFITGLGKKYQNFLLALEEQGISYPEAIQFMKKARPAATAAVAKTRSRTKKEAQAIAKALCRKYAHKSAEEMVAAFMETVKAPAFEIEVLGHIKALETKYLRNEQGKIRVRAAREGMKAQALKAQAARKAKKK